MMIEDEVFQRKRFVPFKMTAFGFTKKEDQYIYETDLMDGAFHAILTVSDKGAVSGKVIDVINDEEYHQLRSRQFHGAYVTRYVTRMSNGCAILPRMSVMRSCLPLIKPIALRN